MGGVAGESFRPVRLADLRFERCPICWLSEQGWLLDLLPDVHRARSGLLPEAGGVHDQDARFVLVWEALDAEQAIVRSRLARDQERDQERRLKKLQDDLRKKKKGRR